MATEEWYTDPGVLDAQEARKAASGLNDGLGVLEALRNLVRYVPSGLECQDFSHGKKDLHEGFDCPCVKRYQDALRAALAILDRA